MQQQLRPEGLVAVGGQHLSARPSNEDLIAIIQPETGSQHASIFYQNSPKLDNLHAQDDSVEVAANFGKPAVSADVGRQDQDQEFQQKNLKPFERLPNFSSDQNVTSLQDSFRNINQNANNVIIQPILETHLPTKGYTHIAAQRRARQNCKTVNQQASQFCPIGRIIRNQQTNTRPPKPMRRQHLYQLLKQVELLQMEITKLPSSKERHYVKPYIRLGQASNLNLNPQTVQTAQQVIESDIAKKKSEIQKAAQLLLQQIQNNKPPVLKAHDEEAYYTNESPEKNANKQSNAVQYETPIQGLIQRPPPPETQICEGTEIKEIQSLDEKDEVQKNGIDNVAGINTAGHESSLKCEDCGHIGVTGTHNTSRAPAYNQELLSLESQQQRIQVKLDSQMQQQSSELDKQIESITPKMTSAGQPLNDFGTSDRITPFTINMPNLSNSNSHPQQKISSIATHGPPTQDKIETCSNCGSSNVTKVKSQQKNRSSMASADKTQKIPRNSRLKHNKKNGDNSMLKTKSVSRRSRYPQREESGAQTVPLNFKQFRNRLGTLATLTSDQHKLDQMVMPEKTANEHSLSQMRHSSKFKQYSTMTLPRELHQINLQIRRRPDEVMPVCQGSVDHSHSQPKIIHSSKKDRSKSRRSAKRSNSTKNGKNYKKSVRLPNGSIICGRCAVTHHYNNMEQQQCPKQNNDESKEDDQDHDNDSSDDPTVETLHECGGGGDGDNDQVTNVQLELKIDQVPSLTTLHPTKRAESDQIPSVAILKHPLTDEVSSKESETNKVSDNSRKIRDSIEFTSQTCSARQQVSLEEMSEEEQELVSEALISELRAIAEGNFELSRDPVLIGSSTEQSEASNRINLLSLGALTATYNDNCGLDAQSNIATNEDMTSINDPLVILHSDRGSKQYQSNTRAEANAMASGAFGSELEYSNSNYFQTGALPLRQMVSEEDYEEEEFEEEFEEELESEIYGCSEGEEEEQESTQDMIGKSMVEIGASDQNSNATSYSDLYIIDEDEEARLKQIAFEKYLAEQAIEDQIDKAKKGVTQYPKKSLEKKKNKNKKGKQKGRKKRHAGSVSSIEVHDRSTQCLEHLQNFPSQEDLYQIKPQDNQSRNNKNLPKQASKVPSSSQVRSRINQSEGDYSEAFRSNDAKSFNTGMNTLKAFRPERLYEETPCINIAKERNPQYTTSGEQLIRNDSKSIEFGSKTGLSHNYDRASMKVKFTTEGLGKMLTNNSQVTSTAKDLNSGPQSPKPGLLFKLQSQFSLHNQLEEKEKLIPSATKIATKRSSQEPVTATYRSNINQTREMSADKIQASQEECSIAEAYEVVTSEKDLFQCNLPKSEGFSLKKDQLQLRQRFNMDSMTNLSNKIVEEDDNYNYASNINYDSGATPADHNFDSNSGNKTAERPVNLPIESMKDSALHRGDPSSKTIKTTTRLGSRDRKISSQKDFSDKYQQFPTEPDNITQNKKSTTGSRSKKSYRRKKSEKAEMVDRSQQDSRCFTNQGEYLPLQKLRSSYEQQLYDKSMPRSRMISGAAGHMSINSRSAAQSASVRPQASSNQTLEATKQTEPEPEKVQWVIIMGHRRPLTSNKPRAGQQSIPGLCSGSEKTSEVRLIDYTDSATQDKCLEGAQSSLIPPYAQQFQQKNQGNETEIAGDRKESERLIKQNEQGSVTLKPSTVGTITVTTLQDKSQLPKESGDDYVKRMMKERGMAKLSDSEAERASDRSRKKQDNQHVQIDRRSSATSQKNNMTHDDSVKNITHRISDTSRTGKRNSILNLKSTVPGTMGETPDCLSTKKNMPYQVKIQQSPARLNPTKKHSIVDLPIEIEHAPNTRKPMKNTQRSRQSQHVTSTGNRSPNAFRINTYGHKNSQKSRCVNLSATSEANATSLGRRRKANQVAYFSKKSAGNQNLRNAKLNFQSQTLFSSEANRHEHGGVLSVSPHQNATRNALATVSSNHQVRKPGTTTTNTGLQLNPQQFYEATNSPKSSQTIPKIMAQSDGMSITWNEKTDKKMNNFLKKRSDFNLKKITQEVDEVKPILFDKSNILFTQQQHKSQLVKQSYGNAGFKSHGQINTVGQAINNMQMQSQASTNLTAKLGGRIDESAEDLPQIDSPKTQDRIDYMSHDGATITKNQPILVSSEILEQQPAYTMLDPALQKFARSDSKPCINNSKLAMQQPYHTIQQSDESVGKLNYQSDSLLEENSAGQNCMSNFSAQYRMFRSQRKGTTSERRNIYKTSSTRKRSPIICDVYFNEHNTIDDAKQQDKTKIDHLSIQVVATSSPIRNQQRLQFYPQTVVKKGALAAPSAMRNNVVRLNYNLSQSTGKQASAINNGFVEYNLIHDNQHAPYLGQKHLKTTAYL